MTHSPEAARPIRRTQAERSQESRRRMLDAAFDLLCETASLQFTLADVGERAGYSRGLPGIVFGSKDGLLRELTQHLNTVSMEMPQMQATGEGFDAALGMMNAIMSASPVQRRVSLGLYILIAEAMRPDSPVRDAMKKVSGWSAAVFARQLRLAIERGEIRGDVDPKAQGAIMLTAAHGAIRHWMLDPERQSVDALRREALITYIRALAVDLARWINGG